MRRQDERRAAVFALYRNNADRRDVITELEAGTGESERELAYATALLEGVVDEQERLEGVIAQYSEGWTLERIAPLEKAIMLIALYEMEFAGSLPGDSPIPPEGAIDEAVETAKLYCGSDAPGFVNGILASALRANRGAATDGDKSPEGSEQ